MAIFHFILLCNKYVWGDRGTWVSISIVYGFHGGFQFSAGASRTHLGPTRFLYNWNWGVCSPAVKRGLSKALYLDSVFRPELASRGPETEHHVQQFIPLLFAVAMKTYINLWAKRWSIPAHSLLRKRFSTSLCLAMAVFSDLTIPAFRRHVKIRKNLAM
jgi:hypothetical protein